MKWKIATTTLSAVASNKQRVISKFGASHKNQLYEFWQKRR